MSSKSNDTEKEENCTAEREEKPELVPLVESLDSKFTKPLPWYLNVLYTALPITKWLSTYSKQSFRFDVVAGLTVGIMAIPQSMAYAMLAGLPPIYGLYCCLMPLFAYGIFGTCGQVTTGPCAIISIMCGAAMNFIKYDDNPADYVGAMMTMSAVSGLFLITLSILRLGSITACLSETVVTAFTTASAFNIAGSQLKHFWGVSTNKDSLLDVLVDIFSKENIAKYNWWSFLIGITCMIILITFKVCNRKLMPKQPLPGELFVMVLYIYLVWQFDLKEKWNIKYLGDYVLPRGFAPVSIPSWRYLGRLIPQGIVISIIAYVITVSMGKTFARRFDYHINDNMELMALGIASLAGSFFSAYPCTGSLSRSSLIANMGARTPVNCLVTPIVIILCLYFLVGVIKYVPNSVLAVIINTNLFSLMRGVSNFKPLFRTSMADFVTFLLCSIATVTIGTQGGLVVGIATSIAATAVAEYVAHRRNAKEGKDAPAEIENTVYCSRFLNFFNRQYLSSAIDRIIDKDNSTICTVNLCSVIYIDASALLLLQDLFKHHSHRIVFVVNNEYIEKKLAAYNMPEVVLCKEGSTANPLSA